MTSRNKQRNPLPKILPGTVLPQMVRCGRDGCRCAQGELHGPYFYRFFRERGRLKKRYVKQADMKAISDACIARRVQKRRMIEVRRSAKRREQLGRTQWRSLVELLKELKGGEL